MAIFSTRSDGHSLRSAWMLMIDLGLERRCPLSHHGHLIHKRVNRLAVISVKPAQNMDLLQHKLLKKLLLLTFHPTFFPSKCSLAMYSEYLIIYTAIAHTHIIHQVYPYIYIFMLHITLTSSFLLIFMAGWLSLAPCVRYTSDIRKDKTTRR